MHAAIDDWQAGRADWVEAWDRRGETCRDKFARLISVPIESVALVPTVSVGVATVAAALTSQDEVLLPDDEFSSVIFPILVAAESRGVTVRQVPFAALHEHVTPKTTLVAFSLVQSQSGRTAAQQLVIDAAKKHNARVLVDATHAVPFITPDPRADFVVCAAYKHLLSPRGVAFLTVKAQHQSTMPPVNANWRSSSQPYGSYYGGPLDVADGAARFDVSLAWFSWAGAAVSLGLLSEWQERGLLAEPVALARRLAKRLGVPQPQGTVLSVPVLEEAENVRQQLANAGIKAAVRAGSVRLSTHVYNTAEDVDRAADALERFVAQPVGR